MARGQTTGRGADGEVERVATEPSRGQLLLAAGDRPIDRAHAGVPSALAAAVDRRRTIAHPHDPRPGARTDLWTQGRFSAALTRG